MLTQALAQPDARIAEDVPLGECGTHTKTGDGHQKALPEGWEYQFVCDRLPEAHIFTFKLNPTSDCHHSPTSSKLVLTSPHFLDTLEV